MSEYITSGEAANILGVNERTVRRYAERSWLPHEHFQSRMLFPRESVESLARGIKVVNDLGNAIKEAYVLHEAGLPTCCMTSEFDRSTQELEDAIKYYELERSGILEPYFNDYSDVLLVTEAAARLKIKDWRIIRGLLDDGYLKPAVPDKKIGKLFISKGSFWDYLGSYQKEILYTSKRASEETGRTVNQIDHIAHDNNIGMKLQPHKPNSIYLFSRADIFALANCKRK